MARRAKRVFTDEFKREAVELTRSGDRSVAQVARDLDLTESALREWVRRAQGTASPALLSGSERQELEQLRKENRVLRMERDLLKKAAAFFARQSP